MGSTILSSYGRIWFSEFVLCSVGRIWFSEFVLCSVGWANCENNSCITGRKLSLNRIFLVVSAVELVFPLLVPADLLLFLQCRWRFLQFPCVVLLGCTWDMFCVYFIKDVKELNIFDFIYTIVLTIFQSCCYFFHFIWWQWYSCFCCFVGGYYCIAWLTSYPRSFWR